MGKEKLLIVYLSQKKGWLPFQGYIFLTKDFVFQSTFKFVKSFFMHHPGRPSNCE